MQHQGVSRPARFFRCHLGQGAHAGRIIKPCRRGGGGQRERLPSRARKRSSKSIGGRIARDRRRTVLEGEQVADAEISLAFVDNATIHQLNKRYLNHDEPTDVLSFPLSEPGAKRLAGELVIGAEVAKVQAESRGHDVQAELALYVIHGLLHLCGHDDKTADHATAMRQRERHYLKALSLPDIAEAE